MLTLGYAAAAGLAFGPAVCAVGLTGVTSPTPPAPACLLLGGR